MLTPLRQDNNTIRYRNRRSTRSRVGTTILFRRRNKNSSKRTRRHEHQTRPTTTKLFGSTTTMMNRRRDSQIRSVGKQTSVNNDINKMRRTSSPNRSIQAMSTMKTRIRPIKRSSVSHRHSNRTHGRQRTRPPRIHTQNLPRGVRRNRQSPSRPHRVKSSNVLTRKSRIVRVTISPSFQRDSISFRPIRRQRVGRGVRHRRPSKVTKGPISRKARFLYLRLRNETFLGFLTTCRCAPIVTRGRTLGEAASLGCL